MQILVDSGLLVGLEDRGWSEWIEKDDEVLMSHFSWKLVSFCDSRNNNCLSWMAGSATDR